MLPQSTFHVGITFHSFANEYCSFIYSFEDMMELAAYLGKGVEIVGPSHQRGFPELTYAFERAFKSAIERYGLIPTSYGSYADPFMLPDRNLTPDELYAYTVPQLHAAAKLGFPVVRLQHFTDGIVERLIPIAEKLKIRMGYELHTPLMIEAPKTQQLLAQIRRLSSEYLGLIPDCGIFARSIPPHYIERGRAMGMSEAQLQQALALWDAKTPIDKTIAIFRAAGAAEAVITWVGMIWDSFGFSDPASLADIREYIFHMHGKFYSMVDGDEPNIRYREVVQTLLQIGYTGWMSSEYEGGAADSLSMVLQHQAMLRRYMTNEQARIAVS